MDSEYNNPEVFIAMWGLHSQGQDIENKSRHNSKERHIEKINCKKVKHQKW